MQLLRLLQIAGIVCTAFIGEVRLYAQPTLMWTSNEATPVMSGPGDSYYPVLKLPRGTQIEVYQQLDNGWLAIRPPQGSFSLVSATAIETVDYRTARVTREGAAARVGSALVEETSAVHVRLQSGELVEVLDPTADPISHLVRISPPAGEFRWVRTADVSACPVGKATGLSETVAAASAVSLEAGSPEEVDQVPAAEPQPPTPEGTQRDTDRDEAVVSPNTPDGEWRVRATEPEAVTYAGGPPDAQGTVAAADYQSGELPATSPLRTDSHPSAGEADSAASPGADARQSASPHNEHSARPVTGAGSDPANSTDSGSFESQLDLLEIKLSRRIAGPANLWIFEDLQGEAARLASIAVQPEQQARIRELGTRMARFAEIANRHRAAVAPPVAGAARPAPATAMASGAPTTGGTADGYDAVGILRPVVSRRPGAPPYALVDAQGEVISFVTPGPSVNLQAYLGQRVAVSGTRAYLPAYRRRNIQTARVQPMEEMRMR